MMTNDAFRGGPVCPVCHQWRPGAHFCPGPKPATDWRLPADRPQEYQGINCCEHCSLPEPPDVR